MSSIKLTKLTPAVQYPASTTVKGCQAGGLGHLLKFMLVYNAESTKQGSKRFNFQGRGNTLPIWVYYLSMVKTIRVYHHTIGISTYVCI